MTAAEAARHYALTLSSVTALVSGRIFTLHLPQDSEPVKLPCVLMQQISDVQTGHTRGTVALKWARVQVDCIASSIKAARALDQILMGDYAGGVTTGLLGSVANVGGSPSIRMIVAPYTLGYQEDRATDELRHSRTIRDYQVWIESV